MKKGDYREDISKLKSYQLRLERDIVTWSYIMDDIRRAGDIIAKQNTVCDGFCDSLKELLPHLPYENRAKIEREIYTYALELATELCKDGGAMLEDYSGMKTLFRQGTKLVKKGKLEAEGFLTRLAQVDQTYILLASVQGFMASQIKEILDEEVLEKDSEYVDRMMGLAQAFGEMWSKCVKRYEYYFAKPNEEFVSSNRKIYEKLLRGLPEQMMDLMRSAWER